MEIDINELITFINGAISNGIPIEDSYTWKSSIAGGITSGVFSLIAILLGGNMALRQYEKQEKVRVKKDLELKYHNDHEDMIINIIQTIKKVSKSINYIYDANLVEYKGENINNIETMTYLYEIQDSYEHDRIKDVQKLVRELIDKLSDLEIFMEIKNTSENYYFIYEDEYQNIKGLYNKFIKLDSIANTFDALENQNEESHCVKNSVENYKCTLLNIIEYYKTGRLEEIKDNIKDKYKEYKTKNFNA